MSDYKQYIDKMKQKDKDFFFGEGNTKQTSNRYFEYRHVVDNDNIVINTNNVIDVKGTWVLVVGWNKAIYLKGWQVKDAHNFDDICEDFKIVKLNRKFFKTYTFQKPFEGFAFDEGEEQTFDDLVAIAASQDDTNMAVAFGHMGE